MDGGRTAAILRERLSRRADGKPGGNHAAGEEERDQSERREERNVLKSLLLPSSPLLVPHGGNKFSSVLPQNMLVSQPH